MRIGIEGVPFFGNLTGVGQFAKRLVEAASLQNSDMDFEIVRQQWFFRSLKPSLAENSKLKYRVVRWVPPIIYYQMFKRLGWAPAYDLVALRKYDIFLFFNFVAFPTRRKTKSILTIYDLSYVYHPEYSSPQNQVYLEEFVPKSIRRSSRIITISENSKREIVDYYKVDPALVEVINPAVDHSVFKPQTSHEIKPVLNKYHIGQPYILSVCTLEPRKNLIGVLDSFELLPEELKKEYALVLVGGKGWLDGDLEAKVNELSNKYKIIKTGYVPDEDLPYIYSGAALFVYPAFYEGFGMPPLEAMACGVPVITSDNSSLPEVVGDAAIMVNAEDSVKLSTEMQLVLTDQKLALKLSKAGIERSKKFSWNKSAKKLLAVLDEVSKA